MTEENMHDIIVSAKNFAVMPSMRAYIEQKLGKLWHFWERIIRIHVEVIVNRHHRRGDIFIVYAHIEAPGHDLRASAEGGTMNAAVDTVYSKLERMVMRAKHKYERG